MSGHIFHRGDLVVTNDDYYALIIGELAGDRLLLRLANGLMVSLEAGALTPVPMGPKRGETSYAVANFIEALGDRYRIGALLEN